MVYDITDPENSTFVNYINSRDFSEDIAGDDSPEGLCFIPAEDSADGNAYLLAACEVSGTVAAYRLTENDVHTMVAPFFSASIPFCTAFSEKQRVSAYSKSAVVWITRLTTASRSAGIFRSPSSAVMISKLRFSISAGRTRSR